MVQASHPLPGLGCYGKLPSHGDFVGRGLPTEFVRVWDHWLQTAIASSKQQLGGHWLQYFLNSPLWRFALSPGVVDQQAWLGLLMPSVDRVGRYFPLSLVQPVGTGNMAELLSLNEAWFKELEQLALLSLQQSWSIEQLEQQLQGLPAPVPSRQTAQPQTSVNPALAFMPNPSRQNTGTPNQGAGSTSQQGLALMLDYCLQEKYRSYSLWTTQGCQWLAPACLVSQGLPEAYSYAALLDGQWQQHQWQQPFSGPLAAATQAAAQAPQQLAGAPLVNSSLPAGSPYRAAEPTQPGYQAVPQKNWSAESDQEDLTLPGMAPLSERPLASSSERPLASSSERPLASLPEKAPASLLERAPATNKPQTSLTDAGQDPGSLEDLGIEDHFDKSVLDDKDPS